MWILAPTWRSALRDSKAVHRAGLSLPRAPLKEERSSWTPDQGRCSLVSYLKARPSVTSGIRREVGLRPHLRALGAPPRPPGPASPSLSPARVATGWVSLGALFAGAQPGMWAPAAPRTDGQPRRSSSTIADPGADRAAHWEGCPCVPPPRGAPDLLGDPRLGERLPGLAQPSCWPALQQLQTTGEGGFLVTLLQKRK